MKNSTATIKKNEHGNKFLHIKENGKLAETAVAVLKNNLVTVHQIVQPFPQTSVYFRKEEIQSIVDFLRSEGITIK